MRKKKKQLITRISLILFLVVLAFYINQYQEPKVAETTNNVLPSDVIEVHFIDVGQGDAILVEAASSAMLIDAGENNRGSDVVNYLTAQNIKKLDFVIATHPHSDHIGGLDNVIQSFPVDQIIMPDVVHSTDSFEDLLDAIEEKNMTIKKPTVGAEYQLGPASFVILAPASGEYAEMNDYSIVIKLTFGDNSFLFTGDAEGQSENEMLTEKTDLTADVIKVGHHGSSYSSTESFLDAVDPSYAVISAGADNEYGHPANETLQAFRDRNAKIYRTDLQGTIVFTSDGKTISVNAQDYEFTDTE